MKMQHTLVGLTVLLIFIVTSAFLGSADPFLEMLAKLEAYNKNNQQEKIHLHLDKPYYAIGEDIWFKAYVLNTVTAEPSQISNTLYVDLINDLDSVERQLIIPLSFGMGWGDFNLKDSLAEGNYRIRAYTRWMQNSGSEYFYDKTIKIGSSLGIKTLATYTYNEEGKVNSLLKFTQKNGTPYALKEVNYEVYFGGKPIKGKATTNSKGEINVGLTNLNENAPQTGRIVATLAISNKEKVTKVVPIKLSSNQLDIQFFPEGGNLVENIPSKIAVKVLGNDGLGKNIMLSIKDQTGTELSKIETKHVGLGSFILNPLPGQRYTAVATFADGSKKEIPIPKQLTAGYVLSVNNSDSSKVSVKIMISDSLLGKGDLKLIVQQNNNVIFSTKASSERQVVAVNFPKEKIRSGIARLTLFTPDNKPAAERLIFISNMSDKLDIQFENKPGESLRTAKITTGFKVLHAGKSTPGSFSVAINNISKVETDELNESNIFTDLLLSSDLAGYIEKPNYYFLNDDVQTRNNFDLLMMTQGWRRFIWNDFLDGKTNAVKFQPEKLLVISGKVTTSGNKPVARGKVTLLSSSSKFFMIDTLTDENGRFAFREMFFGDSTKFAIKAETDKGKNNVNIQMDARPRQLVSRNRNSGDIEVNVNEAIAGYLTKSDNYFNELRRLGLLGNTINLQTVEIVGEKKKVTESLNFNGPGVADYVFTAEQLETKQDLRQALVGRVAGLSFRLNNEGQEIPYLNKAQTSDNLSPMKIILDGMEINADMIGDIIMNDLESIEVLSSTGLSFVYGTNGGVLVLTSKKGKRDSKNISAAPGILPYQPAGYYTARQFYMPKYEPNKTSNLSDYRTTIYWKPNIITDKEGNASFEYVNANEPGTYRVVLEGMDAFGNLGRKVYTYLVN